MALLSFVRAAGVRLVLGSPLHRACRPCCWRTRRSAADITVILDQATLVKLPERVATLVIGNPADRRRLRAGRRHDGDHRQGLWRDQHHRARPQRAPC